MPLYKLKKMPEALGSFLETTIEENNFPLNDEAAGEIHEIQEQFRDLIIRRQSPQATLNNIHPASENDWSMLDVKLEEAWKGYREIRLFYDHVKIVSLLWLKNTEGKREVYCIKGENGADLLRLFIKEIHSGSRRIGVADQALIESSFWSNLQGYFLSRDGKEEHTPLHVYKSLNAATADVLQSSLINATSNKPVLILDLGCGTGKLEQLVMQKMQSRSDVYWLGVDLDKTNIDVATQTKVGNNSYFVSKNVDMFLSDPTNNVRLSDQGGEGFCEDTIENVQKDYGTAELFPKDLFDDKDIYVVASGFLSEGVIEFDHAVSIMKKIANMPNLKQVVLTGLHASLITPYMLKQMGFEPSPTPVNSSHTHNIETYVPVSQDKLNARIIKKMKKHGVLDLSYVRDVKSVLNAIESDDLKAITHIYLVANSSGATLLRQDTSHLDEVNRLLVAHPHLMVWCGALNHEEKVSNDVTFPFLSCKTRFFSIGYIRTQPIFSPHFFYQAACVDDKRARTSMTQSPVVHFMRGLCRKTSYDSQLRFYERTLLYQLSMALNNDKSKDREVRVMIRQMINQEVLFFVNKITPEYLVNKIQASKVSDELKKAAIDYVRLVPIECSANVGDGMERYLLIDNSSSAKQLAQTYHSDGQNIFPPEEWSAVIKRY